ncbi:hypothetical protein NESM_000875400 [Novymonas esmeraldas]|uniref:Uncharacterized protein n=1 Tax=Novymonas esmeraldas TaxID=1808958 RepID=A0AAW0EZP0_9TRYP
MVFFYFPGGTNLSTQAIVGIIFACAGFLGLIVFGITYYVRRKRMKQQQQQLEAANAAQTMQTPYGGRTSPSAPPYGGPPVAGGTVAAFHEFPAAPQPTYGTPPGYTGYGYTGGGGGGDQGAWRPPSSAPPQYPGVVVEQQQNPGTTTDAAMVYGTSAYYPPPPPAAGGRPDGAGPVKPL